MDNGVRLYGLRGAVCAYNTELEIQDSVRQLYEKLILINNISSDNIVSIIFSVTSDLTTLNPATALRKAGYGSEIPLFCCSEPNIEGSLSGVIRVLITCYNEKKPVPVFIKGAEKLRPDISEIKHI